MKKSYHSEEVAGVGKNCIGEMSLKEKAAS